jgi:hypothetical protein
MCDEVIKSPQLKISRKKSELSHLYYDSVPCAQRVLSKEKIIISFKVLLFSLLILLI